MTFTVEVRAHVDPRFRRIVWLATTQTGAAHVLDYEDVLATELEAAKRRLPWSAR